MRTIKKQTYQCKVCKKIFTSKRRALECEEICVDNRDNWILKPRTVMAKIEGKKMYIQIFDRIPKNPLWFVDKEPTK